MFLRKNSMITRNGDSRQAERTREYVSIGENRMSVRANFNKKHYDIKKTLCFCRVLFLCKCTRLRTAPISVTTTDSSRTAPSRHTQIHTYRCFRQDLTRFVRFMLRKNPSFNTSYCGQASQETPSGREFIPYIADLWLQDAATFPTSTWRREGDSNP